MSRNFNLRELLGERGPKRTIKLALGALILCDLLFYLFAIGPLAESDRERRAQVENLRRLVRDRTVQVDRLSSRVQKVQTARTEGDKLLDSIAMVRRSAYSSIVSELDDAAKKAGVELKDRSLNLDPIEGSDTLSMVTVTQGLEGNYENLVRFLNLLDRSERFLIIDSLGAAPQQSATQQQAGAKLSVTVKLDTFVRES